MKLLIVLYHLSIFTMEKVEGNGRFISLKASTDEEEAGTEA